MNMELADLEDNLRMEVLHINQLNLPGRPGNLSLASLSQTPRKLLVLSYSNSTINTSTEAYIHIYVHGDSNLLQQTPPLRLLYIPYLSVCMYVYAFLLYVIICIAWRRKA